MTSVQEGVSGISGARHAAGTAGVRTDPRGQPLARFWDTFIAPNDIRFHIEHDDIVNRLVADGARGAVLLPEAADAADHESGRVPARAHDRYWLNTSTMPITAGPSRTMNRVGMMHSSSGKITLTGSCIAFSSAR